MSKTKEVSSQVNEEVLAELRASYPSEPSALRIILPRIGMYSQDKTEGKGKAMKVIAEAGVFYTERQTDEVNEDTGKKIWDKEEIGTKFEGIILYQRKQLRHYDENNDKYTSSPVYDTDDEIVPLFCDKKEVDRGTPAELKSRPEYQYVKDGKTKSKLEDNRILYIMYKENMYQMNLRGSSMYSYMTYARSVIPSTVVTKFGSEAKEKGTIAWNQMTFTIARDLDAEELQEVLTTVQKLKNTIAVEKQQYSDVKKIEKSDDELDKLALDAGKALE